MTPEDLFKYSVTYGLGIVLAVLMALFLFWVLRYVLRENSRREEKLASLIDGNLKTMSEQMMKMISAFSAHDSWEHESQATARIAFEHQHREHEEQLEALRRIGKP